MSSRNEPLPCPFCGEEPETDFHQGYRNISTGELGDAVAIYCTDCSCHMSFCREDARELTTDDIFQMLLEQWNKRALKTAPDASAPTAPEGLVMVPREPTEAMNDAAMQAYSGSDKKYPDHFVLIYKAMLAAAPAQKGGES